MLFFRKNKKVCKSVLTDLLQGTTTYETVSMTGILEKLKKGNSQEKEERQIDLQYFTKKKKVKPVYQQMTSSP